MTGWPWPLDGVQSWFESLWRTLEGAIGGVVSSLINWIWEKLCWLKDRLVEAGLGLINAIWGAILWVKDRLVEVGTALWEGLKWLWNEIYSRLQWVWSQIINGINFIKSWIWEKIRWLTGILERIANKIWNWIWEKISWVWNLISKALTDLGSRVLKGIADLFNPVIEMSQGVLIGIVEALGKAIKGFFEWLYGALKWIVETVLNVVFALKDWLVDVVTPYFRDMVNKAIEYLKPSSPPQELVEPVQAFSTGLIEMFEEISQVPKGSQPPWEALLIAVGSVITRLYLLKLGVEILGVVAEQPDMIKERMFYRTASGIIAVLDFPAVIGPLLRMPIETGILIPWRYWWQKRYTPMLPGVVDLIRMVVKEAFVPEVITPAPDLFADYMEFLGFAREWSDRFWTAHWVLPPAERLYMAYWRGIIGWDHVTKYIYYHDYRPEPIPPFEVSDVDLMLQTAWTLYSRIDIRWAFEWGTLPDPETVYGRKIPPLEVTIPLGVAETNMAKWLIMLGTDPKIAGYIAKAWARNILREEKMRIARAFFEAYEKGYITDEALRTKLADLGIGADRVAHYMEAMERERENRELDLHMRVLIEAYKKQKIDLTKFLAEAQALGIQGWRVHLEAKRIDWEAEITG